MARTTIELRDSGYHIINTEAEALEKLESMPEAEFQEFFAWLPLRTQMMLKGHMVSWGEVLPAWYLKYQQRPVKS